MALTGLLILSSGFFLLAIASIPAINQRARGLFYGWKMVGISVLVGSLISGSLLSGVGVWVKVLEDQFPWSRTQLTGAFSLTQLQSGAIGPIIGYFIDRLGPRRMVLIGLVLTGLGFVVFSRTTNLATFYLAFTLIMLGATSGTWLPFMTVANRWFIRKRTTAMAVSGEGHFIGGFLLIPLLAWAVTPSNYGWSTTALWIGVMFLAVAWPMSRFIRDRPEDYGQHPDGEAPSNPQEQRRPVDDRSDRKMLASDQADFTAGEAIRTSAFWYISFGHALSSMLFSTLKVHLILLLTDQGLSLQSAAYMWSVLMVSGAVFLPVGGYLGDRVPKTLAIFGFTTCQAIGFLLAAFAHSMPMAILAVVLYGAGFGGRDPLTSSIRGDYFGRTAFATITGISMVPLFAFNLGAPLFAATMFDTSGSYTLAFVILGSLGALSGVFFLLAKKPESIDSPRGLGPVKSPA